jgi:hypothetical protein
VTLAGQIAWDEGGYTLLELLAGMTLTLVTVGATLGLLSNFETTTRENEKQNDAQEEVRRGVNRLAGDLRNLASPTPQQPNAVEKAGPYDLVFQTVDPIGPNEGANPSNIRRVRYCLDSSDPGRGKVWSQTQTWTSSAVPPMPSTDSCPDGGWGNHRLAAEHVTNRNGGREAAVWAYNSTTLSEISSIRTELYVDDEVGKDPAETRLSTGVFLRNQNRRPTARFTPTVAGSGHVLLNGWNSSDPEGDTLTYVWYEESTEIGRGITLDYAVPGTGPRTFRLKVLDSAGLEHESEPQDVNVT